MRSILCLLILLPSLAIGQSEPSKFEIKGYVKEMVSLGRFKSDLFSADSLDNLIHNRLNFAWYPNENWTAKLEIRTRLINGDTYQNVPGYEKLIDNNNDYFDLSWIPVSSNKTLLHTMVDRVFVQYNKNDWEVTLGRQRLNWGVNLAWNPNDLFNSYNFVDFDYEERQGSDAFRVRKYTGYASEVEFAIKAADSFEELTGAFKYQINKWNYDIQFIGGVMKNNLAIGTGWAGNIKGLGFKGEFTYLNEFASTNSGAIGSISLDYLFPNSFYLNGSAMYSSYGAANPSSGFVGSNVNLDIRNLSPYNWSTFLQLAYPIHPLLNAGFSTMLFPSDGSTLLIPSLTYSIVENLDLDLISQMYFGDLYDYNSVFLRIKFSY